MAGALTYGKRMLKNSLESRSADLRQFSSRQKRRGNDDDQFWCETGLDQDGFETKFISRSIGYGVFTRKLFPKGSFLLEYVGERISKEEAITREQKRRGKRCFMYHFKWNGNRCIDATTITDRLARYINDAPSGDVRNNSTMKLKVFNNYPRLCLYASRDIVEGEEVCYDYGDHSHNLPWRKHEVASAYSTHINEKEDSDPFDLIVEKEKEDSDPFDLIVEKEKEDSEPLDLIVEKEKEDSEPFDLIVEKEKEDSEPFELIVEKEKEDSEPFDLIVEKEKEDSDFELMVENSESSTSTLVMLNPLADLPALRISPHLDEGPVDSIDGQVDILEADMQQIYKAQQKEDKQEQGNEHVSVAKKQKTYKKPDRFCTYCNNVILSGKLKRHIKRKHKNEQEIKEILSKPANIQNAFFDLKRREGIYEYNLKLMSEDKEPEMRERTPKHDDCLRVCMDCKSYFSNKYFFKHKCTQSVTAKPEALKPSLLQRSEDRIDKDGEFRDILNRFRDGEVGEICRTNRMIRMIGYRHFNLRRHEESKKVEVRKVVTAEMRELARLFLKYKELSGEKTVESMFKRENLQDLKDAVEQMVISGTGQKHGQKLFLDAVILRSIKALQGFYAESMQDGKGKELKHFKEAYKFKSCEMYPSARQQCIKNSMEKLRKPANLPNELELSKLKAFLESELQAIQQNFIIENYPYLRTLIVSRLTLFNARRGEEASRLLLSEWRDAEKDAWLPADMVEQISDEGEKYLAGQFKLAYLKGKGRKFVPLLVPNDLINGIRILLFHRQEFGIPDSNLFLFATKSPDSHCSGWHAIKEVCMKANVSIPVTAGKMRHRLSTIYASLHMQKDHQKTFLDHMGHDLEINKENYQCPAGIKTVCIMGKILTDIDEGPAITKSASPEIIGNLIDGDITNDKDDDRPSRGKKARYCSGPAITKSASPEIIGNLIDGDITNDKDDDRPSRGKKARYCSGPAITKSASPEIIGNLIDGDITNDKDDDRPSRGKKARYCSDDYDFDDDVADADYVCDDDDDHDEDSDDDVEDEIVIQHQRKKSRSSSVKWSECDTKNLRCYFEDCVYSNKDSNNKGNLPSKKQILQFLQENKPASVQNLDQHQQYLKTRAKLFNERKTMRGKVKGRLQKLLTRK